MELGCESACECVSGGGGGSVGRRGSNSATQTHSCAATYCSLVAAVTVLGEPPENRLARPGVNVTATSHCPLVVADTSIPINWSSLMETPLLGPGWNRRYRYAARWVGVAGATGISFHPSSADPIVAMVV